MMDIAFVVLHYLAVDDTIECVESIMKNIDTDQYKIVIVDNGSPDDSFVVLREKYADNAFVHLIQNEENLGFARGNNVGFRFAKNEWNAKFIVLLNNDTCIYQKNIYEVVQRKYQEYEFSVLGPMILTKDGKCTSNPSRWKLYTFDECVAEMQRIKHIDSIETNVCLSALDELKKRVKLMVKALLGIEKKVQDFDENERQLSDCTQVMLHGSFMVFSQAFIKERDGLDDRTFMYFEEDILTLQLLQKNKVILYTPDIVIYHKEDASTNAVNRGVKKQKQFKRKHMLDSMQLYLNLLKEYEEL